MSGFLPFGRNVQTGTSQAQGNNQANTIPNTRSLATPSSDPTAVMGAREVSQAAIRLPSDTPPYYFRMTVSDYRRDNWLHVGDLTPNTWVILPMPSNIVDAQEVDWEGNEIGYAGSLAIANRNIGLGDVQAGVGRVLREGASVLGQAINEQTGLDLSGVAQGAAAAMGISVNNFLTLMLKGPVYKKHNFTWKISPNTPEETQSLADLYRLISNKQAVGINGLGLGTAFFSYPSIFTLEFKHLTAGPLDKMLFKMKPCVLARAMWNFTPAGSPAFYGETKGPNSVQFSLDFIDLEYFLTGDY